MDISKESFLKAEDSKNRDAMLFDMLAGISKQIDECNKIEERVEKCEDDITFIKGIGATVSVCFTGVMAWLGFK